jgi:hypothetical protein
MSDDDDLKQFEEDFPGWLHGHGVTALAWNADSELEPLKQAIAGLVNMVAAEQAVSVIRDLDHILGWLDSDADLLSRVAGTRLNVAELRERLRLIADPDGAQPGYSTADRLAEIPKVVRDNLASLNDLLAEIMGAMLGIGVSDPEFVIMARAVLNGHTTALGMVPAGHDRGGVIHLVEPLVPRGLTKSVTGAGGDTLLVNDLVKITGITRLGRVGGDLAEHEGSGRVTALYPADSYGVACVTVEDQHGVKLTVPGSRVHLDPAPYGTENGLTP